MSLAADERDHYQRKGYLLVRGLIDNETVAGIEARFRALVLGEVPAPENLVIMKDVAFVKGDRTPQSPLHAVNKILSFEDDPPLWRFATDARLLERVRGLIGSELGPELQTLSTNVFNKPPDVDGRHPLHQDLRYFALRPAEGIVATWTALQPCRRENGCLAVIPGSHSGPLAEHSEPEWSETNFGFFAAQGVDVQARVHVEMDPGDTLFFHPLLVHGSGRNRSAGFRRAISVHYASLACRRPEEMGGRRRATRRIATAIRRIV